ncbi:MAG: RNA polymerase sigma factor [Candidatus Magasanikbacteria bacterium]
MKSLKEKSLLYKIRKEKDPDAFGELYDGYVEKIYRFVSFKISNKQEAEDLVSEIFLKAWQYLIGEQHKSIQNFSGFIYKIARNMIVDVYRARAAQREIPFEGAENMPELQTQKVAEHVLIKSDAESLLIHLQSMKQEYQEVLLLKYMEGFSTAEISQILGKKKNNIRVIIHRATKLLRELTGEQDLS